MSSMSVRKKLFSGFALVTILGVFLGVVGFVSVFMLKNTSERIAHIQDTSSGASTVLNAHFSWRQNLIEAVLKETDFTGSLDHTTCALGAWRNSSDAQAITDSVVLDLLRRMDEPHAFIHSEAKQVVGFIQSGQKDKAEEVLLNDILPKTQEVISLLTEMQNRFSAIVHDENESVVNMENMINLLNFGLIVLVIALSVFLAFMISNLISKPLTFASELLKEVSDYIGSAVEQLSFTSSSLADASSQQAASIEETSATMTETTAMLKSTVENTIRANELAREVGGLMTEAVHRSENLTTSMEELSTSSMEISKIVSAISDISFQTNILALNASVEGTRAGDAGRGFMVVAEEVRMLAQKSSQSASDTGVIVGKNRVLTGSNVDNSIAVSRMMSEAGDRALLTSSLLDEIAHASEEQLRAVEHINIAISQMEDTTQASAAISEESAASAAELQNQIANLQEVYQNIRNLVYGKGH